MSNSANRNAGNNKGGVGHKEDVNNPGPAPKPNPERSDIKHGDHDKDHHGDTSRSSNQGRKEASGGEVEE